MTEVERLEELTVTRLERTILGAQTHKKIESIMRKRKVRGTLAAFCPGEMQYLRAYIYVYPPLLSLEDEEFKLVASGTLLHEMLHVLMYPLTAFAESLLK